MRIEQIEIKNYRVFRDIRLTKLPPMTVVIGANGTGKSTLFDVFSFLKDALAGNAASAVAPARRIPGTGQPGKGGVRSGSRSSFERAVAAWLRTSLK